MKKIVKYQCEVCRKLFISQSEAEKCERSHVTNIENIEDYFKGLGRGQYSVYEAYHIKHGGSITLLSAIIEYIDLYTFMAIEPELEKNKEAIKGERSVVLEIKEENDVQYGFQVYPRLYTVKEWEHRLSTLRVEEE